MDFELIEQSLPYLIQGALITIEITLMAVGIGFFIGLFAGIARICRIKALRIIATIYADCIRGTPLLVQIFLIYFALPMLIHTQINPFVAAVTACAINSGAYVSEIFRAGIQAIDQGQFEAGRSLGLSWWQTMYYIILPQAFHNILPPLGNEFITMLKDSSLVSVIGFDINEDRLDKLRNGIDPCGELSSEVFEHKDITFTSSIEKLREASFYVIAVPTPIDSHNEPDLSPLLGATRTVGKVLKRGDYVVYELSLIHI